MRADPLDRAFAALADRTRRATVELLQQRPRRAGELASELAVSAPALTRHLRVLRTSELVEESVDERDGRVRIYRLRPEVFGRLRSWVDRVEQLWSGQVASFAPHVDAVAKKGKPRVRSRA
jgi:DNA-binding transcriptional ArsR family regulator